MATAKWIIKDGKIVGRKDYRDPEFKPTTEMDICGGNNGVKWNIPWHVKITKNKIICTCEYEYFNGGIKKKKKVFNLEDGILGLSGGYIPERYAYFRSEAFQKWLNENGLSQIDTKTIDQTEGHIIKYNMHDAYCSKGESSYIIITDGKLVKEEIKSKPWVDHYEGLSQGDSRTDYEFTDCTWMIEYSASYYDDGPCNSHSSAGILYIKKGVNPMEFFDINELPNYIQERMAEFSSRSASHVYTEVNMSNKLYRSTYTGGMKQKTYRSTYTGRMCDTDGNFIREEER